ncbi:hypothetical protein [Corynebacterium pseudodiphtheriticum]|uniref:hypothetical protein n=1 Tax=Corynebacterium pseudodiphtheriticum TaxID=37637 RepID=UPI002542DF6A|nr:hypothetical protein [Corynebacterium pseudodiphtheriticum]
MKSRLIMKMLERGAMPSINGRQVRFIAEQTNLEVEAIKKSDNAAYKNGVMYGINRTLELLLNQWKESERQAEQLITQLDSATEDDD